MSYIAVQVNDVLSLVITTAVKEFYFLTP